MQPTGLLTLRKPMPVARSVHWVPVAGAGGDSAPVIEVPLFVTQGALREAMRHLRSDPEQELMGFLLGNLFEDTSTGARYVVITSALRTGHVITEEEPVQIPQEEWLGMQLELRRRRAGLMGWYHSMPFVGPNPARLDLETHRERFMEPWQTGLVIATAGPEPTGGFFRLSAGERMVNGLFIPFDELVDDESLLPGGRKRTLIDWANYRTGQDVETDRTERRPHLPPRPPRVPSPQPRPTPAPMGAPAAGGEPGPGAAALPVMLPEPSELDDTPAMPAPERSRTRLALFAAIVLGVAGAAGGLWWWNQHVGPEPAPGFSTDVLRPQGGRRPAPVARPVDTSGLASRITGDSGALGLDTLGGGAGAAGTGAGGAMSTAPVTPAPVVPPVSPPDVAARPAPSTDAHVARFDAMADSLEQAIRNFGDRSSDFAMKRLSCAGLGVGYRAADDAYIALAAAYRDARAVIDSGRDARFRRLSSQMGGVNTAFDGTKCPRP